MKNTKMKKFLAVVLSAALVAGLAAVFSSNGSGIYDSSNGSRLRKQRRR